MKAPSLGVTRLTDRREVKVSVPAPRAYEPIAVLGGEVGWYYGNWLWSLRGALDRLAGGRGARRPRARTPRAGDALGLWKVERVEEGRFLRLIAEMRLPGRAWLEFEVTPEPGGAVIRQTAVFVPSGLLGLLYWYGLYPVHRMVFAGMLRGIAAAAARAALR